MSEPQTEDDFYALIAPARSYSEEAHARAYLRYAMSLLKDELYSIFYSVKHKGRPAEEAVEALHKLLFPEDRPDDDGDEYDWFLPLVHAPPAALREEAEGGLHCGDCTSDPCSCTRCYVDGFYGVYTVPPDRRSARQYLNKYVELRKARLAAEAASGAGK